MNYNIDYQISDCGYYDNDNDNDNDKVFPKKVKLKNYKKPEILAQSKAIINNKCKLDKN